MCDQVSDEYAKEMKLFITTNLTELDYKGNSVHKLAEKFKHLLLEVSCDHYGEKLKWIRYPIDVDKFEENLYRMKPYIDCIMCTVSILNIFDLKEIEEYYMNNFRITVNWYALYNPSSLSIKNIPNKEDIPYIPTDEIRGELMKEEVPSELEKGYEYIRSLEDHRGIQNTREKFMKKTYCHIKIDTERDENFSEQVLKLLQDYYCVDNETPQMDACSRRKRILLW